MVSAAHNTMNQRTSLFTVAAATAALLIIVLSGCDPSGGTDDIVSVGDALVSFPAALVNSTAATASVRALSVTPMTTSADIVTYLDYVYRPVRDSYNPLAKNAIEFVDATLDSVDTHVFGNTAIMSALNETGTWTGEDTTKAEKYRVTLLNGTYTVEIWNTVDTEWLKTLHLSFTRAGSRYFGTVTAVDDTSGLTERPSYEVTFDTHDPDYGKLTELTAVSIAPDDAGASNIPRKLWLKAWQVDNDFFITANVHYVHVDIETGSDYYEQFMTELAGGTWTPGDEVEASYIYRGAADTTSEQGSVSLALVPAAVTDTTSIFDTYSIGAIYRKAIADWINANGPTDEDGGDTTPIITTLNSLLSNAGATLLDDSGPQANNTTAEVFTALEAVKTYLNSQGTSSSGLDAILFVVEVVNPGYYDDTNGFVGTATLNTPTWSGAVPVCDAAVGTSAADIAADTFTVTMPSPAQPPF